MQSLLSLDQRPRIRCTLRDCNAFFTHQCRKFRIDLVCGAQSWELLTLHFYNPGQYYDWVADDTGGTLGSLHTNILDIYPVQGQYQVRQYPHEWQEQYYSAAQVLYILQTIYAAMPENCSITQALQRAIDWVTARKE